MLVRLPCTPQLSPRFQAVLAVLQLLPITLFVLQLQRDISGGSSSSTAGAGYGGSWLSAAASSVGGSLLAVALSCATDLHCRRNFLRQEREQQQHERQQRQGQGQAQELTKRVATEPWEWGQQGKS